MTAPRPVAVEPEELAEWSERVPLAFRLALFLARRSPRGQGWFPRFIGRHGCRRMKLVLRTQSGARIAVDPRSLDYYTLMLKQHGIVDARVRNACLRVLGGGDVFYDIGANAGLISLEIAARLGGDVRVFAFEPQPWLARTAAVSGALNGYAAWSVYACMLGREDGVGELFVPASTVHASAIGREPGAPAIRCPRTTVDSLVEAGGLPPPRVMKIDVEGGERDVLLGAARTISAHTPAIVFEADANLERFGYGRRDLFALLRSLADYRFYFLRETELVPAEPDPGNGTFTDVLAVTACQAAAT